MSRFLTQTDENDNYPVKLLDFAMAQAIEEENSSGNFEIVGLEV